MEIVDIIDEFDNVVGSAERYDSYRKKLRSRVSHVFVFNSDNQVLLQKRSRFKTRPLHWHTSVNGTVQSGENYEDAAVREMEEEIGVALDLHHFEKYNFIHPNGHPVSLGIFCAYSDGPFSPDPQEVHELQFFDLGALKRLESEELCHQELIFLMDTYPKITI